MKWYNIILLSLLGLIILFLFFYGKAIYKGIIGINKLVKSEAFQGLIKSEGFQNMVKNKDYKNIRNLEGFRNVVKEGFTSGCSSCDKEGFQINISDLTNIDLSGSITSIANYHNIDLSNVDTSQITPASIIQTINNTPTTTTDTSTTATDTTTTARPDINDSNVQCNTFKNQLNSFNDLRQKYRDVGDWTNVRIINGNVNELQNKINEMGCAS